MSNNLNEIKSPIMRMAASYLEEVLNNIKSGNCDENEAAAVLAQLHPLKHGYLSNEELVNVEKGCNILGLGNNRAKFYVLVKKYHVQEVVMNNQKVGYLKRDLMRIKQAETA